MVNVIKADRTIEPYSEEKIISSIKRAGIPQSLHGEVINHINSRLYENIPTSEIYSHIQEYFGSSNDRASGSKYSLKRAIMELGPTGFPFEVYVSEILKSEGYATLVGQTLPGKCVNHEVDVVAEKDGEKLMVECKFHNRIGTRSDLHVSLYTKARFDDLKEKHGFTRGMLATNTKITVDALAYADCEDLSVLSWSYPEGWGIRDLVEKYKLYPITQLSFLSLTNKQELLAKDIVLISQLCKNFDVLDQIAIPKNKREEIENLAREVCRL